MSGVTLAKAVSNTVGVIPAFRASARKPACHSAEGLGRLDIEIGHRPGAQLWRGAALRGAVWKRGQGLSVGGGGFFGAGD
jgi:hypothetical protein